MNDIIFIYDQGKTQDRIILHEINKADKNIQFKMSTEESNTINYLDITIYRNNNMDISIYRKTTQQSNFPLTIHMSTRLQHSNAIKTG